MRVLVSWLILLAGLLLVGCQGVPTRTPMATASPTQSTATRSLFTPTPSATFTPLPSSTPTQTPLPPTLTPSPSPTPLYRGAPYLNENGVLLRFSTEQEWVILTIDDGLSKSAALEMLDALKAANVRATFFLAGKCALNTLGSEVMQRMASEGHEIAYHSMEHPALEIQQKWTIAEWEADYAAWQAAVLATLGEEFYSQAVRPFARAPYGLFNQAFLQLCANHGLTPVGWSCDPLCVDGTLPMPGGRILIYHVRSDQVESLKALLSMKRTVLPLGEALK